MKATERVQNTQQMMKKLEHERNENRKNKVKPRQNDMGSSTIQWGQNYKEQLTKHFMAAGHFFNLDLNS